MTLVETIIDQLQVTRQQAEGGAGLLLQQAQQKLSNKEFLRVADTIPAISDLIAKAPRQTHVSWWRIIWSRLFGGWGSLAPLRPAFEKLQLDRSMINRFIEALAGKFRELGGAEVETLLRSAWR